MDKASEEWRHICEVRHVLRMRQKGRDKVNDYIAIVEVKRGASAAAKLRDDCAAQWAAGNRGAEGDWR